MGKLKLIVICGLFSLALLRVSAGTYTMADGQTVAGEPVSYDRTGVVLKTGDGSFLPRTPWTKFSQEALKQLAAEAKRPQDAEFITPYLEETIQQEQKARQSMPVKQPERVELPKGRVGLIAALASPLGFTIFLILYLANLYAAYEIALYRGLPLAIPCGVSAALPIIGPLVFLSVPPHLLGIAPEPTSVEEVSAPSEAAPPAPAATAETAGVTPATSPATPAAAPPARPSSTPAPSTTAPKTFKLRTQQLAAAAIPPAAPTPATPSVPRIVIDAPEPEAAPPPSNLPPVITFRKGEFTFNRRFFETKMPGFFRIVPTEADKDMVLYIKSARGEFVGKRIPKITQNDLTLLTFKDQATAEEMIPFTEIYEVQIRHKDMV